MTKFKLLLACVVLLVSLSSNALVLDLSLFYDTRALTTVSPATESQMLIDFVLAMDVLKKPRLVVGWSYGMFSTSDASASTTNISTSDMGPTFGWFIDKDEKWSLFLTYNLLATASYTAAGGSADTWRGTSIKADVGWTVPIADSFYCGLQLNYYSATYTEKFAGGTTYSQVSYARSFMYPSVVFSYRM